MDSKILNKIKFLLGFLLSQVFCLQLASASTNGLVINEVMIGQTGASKNEFIELYNSSDTVIDLTGYSLKKKAKTGSESNLVSSGKFTGSIPAKDYFLISSPEYQSIIQADLVYSGTSYSIANDNTILLYNAVGELIDKIGYGAATDSEVQAAASLNPDQSLERQPIGSDSDNNSFDFFISAMPSPTNSKNSATNQSPVNTSPISDPVQTSVANTGDVVINEFLAQPLTGEKEWIEFYSNFNQTISLNNWTIEDGTGKVILNLTGDLLSHGFVVFDLSSAKLNNSGDILILKDASGKIIDQVAYGDWNDGNTADNIAIGDSGQSLSRLSDGADTNIDKNDFAVTAIPTKNVVNQIQNNVSQTNLVRSNNKIGAVYYGSLPGIVVFNEVVADPESGPEWVELFNKTDNTVDLTGWQIKDGYDTKTDLSGSLAPKSYLVIDDLKSSLNNSGDQLILIDNYQVVIDQMAYGNWDDGNINNNALKASDPNSLARIGNSQDTNDDFADWQLTSVLTKNAANIFLNSTDQLTATVSLKNKIIITELFPNPAGPDNDEFIELKNISQDKINLTGLIVGDNSKSRYTIKNSDASPVWILPDEFYLVRRAQSKIALNNNGGDQAFLFDSQKNIIDQVGYQGKAEEDQSYSLIDNNWVWTDQPTPVQSNLLITKNLPPVAVINADKSELMIGEKIILDSSDSYDPEGKDLVTEWQLDDKVYQDVQWPLTFDQIGEYLVKLTVSDGELKTTDQLLLTVTDSVVDDNQTGDNKKVVAKKKTSVITKAKDLALNTKIKLSGLVTSEPGKLGAKIFYLSDFETKDNTIIPLSGLAVYGYLPEWPVLKIGDVVEVSGAIGQSQGIKRLRIKSSGQVKIIGHYENIVPELVSVADINSELVGNLIKVEGEIIEIKNSTLFLDDQSGEIKAPIKKGLEITTTQFIEGEKIKLSGILSQTVAGYTLLPRQASDVVKIVVADSALLQADTKPIVFSSTKETWLKYVTAALGAAMIVLINISLKVYKKKDS